MAYGFKVFWMVITYILWGSIFYTSINIPYGSMASAVSADPKHRAELSTWRTIGATLAGLVIGVGTPVFAYETVNGNTVLSGPRMTIIAGVFGVMAIICYLLCFSLVRERVEYWKSIKKSCYKPFVTWYYSSSDCFASCNVDNARYGRLCVPKLL